MSLGSEPQARCPGWLTGTLAWVPTTGAGKPNVSSTPALLGRKWTCSPSSEVLTDFSLEGSTHLFCYLEHLSFPNIRRSQHPVHRASAARFISDTAFSFQKTKCPQGKAASQTRAGRTAAFPCVQGHFRGAGCGFQVLSASPDIRS